jgi:hypothetical protein
MPRAQFMRENQPSKFTEILIWIFIFLIGTFAISNVLQGKVAHPSSFFIMLIGFVLFFISKLSVIIKKKWISFGTRSMSAWMANSYRIGYWLMIFGFLATFAP